MNSLLVNWKTSLAGVVLIVVGIMGAILGIHIPGFSMDSGAAITMGIGLLVAKDSTPPTVAKALLFAFLLSAFLAPRAMAGDIAAPVFPIKAVAAPAPAGCSATGCSGAFLGAEFSGSGTGVNVLNLGSLSANGNYMGVNGGYQFFNGTYWLSAEVEATYDVAPPAGLTSAGFGNKLFAFEGIEVGGYLSSLFNISPISLPGPLAGAVPTIKIGACQNGSHLSGYCAGAAAHFFIPNSKFTVDVSYLNAQYGSTQIAPNATANVENRGSFGFSYHF